MGDDEVHSTRRSKLAVHWSNNVGPDDVFIETTRFVYKNGKWIHEAKQKPLDTNKDCKSKAESSTDEGKDDATKDVGNANLSPSTDSSKSINSNNNSTTTKPEKYIKTKVLGFAKRKLTSLTDFLKKDNTAGEVNNFIDNSTSDASIKSNEFHANVKDHLNQVSQESDKIDSGDKSNLFVESKHEAALTLSPGLCKTSNNTPKKPPRPKKERNRESKLPTCTYDYKNEYTLVADKNHVRDDVKSGETDLSQTPLPFNSLTKSHVEINSLDQNLSRLNMNIHENRYSDQTRSQKENRVTLQKFDINTNSHLNKNNSFNDGGYTVPVQSRDTDITCFENEQIRQLDKRDLDCSLEQTCRTPYLKLNENVFIAHLKGHKALGSNYVDKSKLYEDNKQCNKMSENETELKIIESEDEPETGNVKQLKDYRKRRVRYTTHEGEYHEITQSATKSTAERTQTVKNTSGNKVAVLKQCLAVAQLKKESVRNTNRNFDQKSQSSTKTLYEEDLTPKRAQKEVSKEIKHKTVFNILNKNSSPIVDTHQVTRLVKDEAIAVETIYNLSESNKPISLDKAEISIPKERNSRIDRDNKGRQNDLALSKSGVSQHSLSQPLGMRYREIQNIVSQEKQLLPTQNMSVSDSEYKVLLASIEGYLAEKERELFNPYSQFPHKESNKRNENSAILSQEEYEMLAKSRIIAQVNASLGDRQMLRKKSLIIDGEKLEELFLRCIICNDRYDADEHLPKVLPCHHTFCLYCLQEMFRVEAEHRQSLTSAFQVMPTFVSINCPTCRENHMINDRNYSDFKLDQKVMELLEISAKSVNDKFGYCTKHRTQTLEYFCESCVEQICSDCKVIDHNEANQHHVFQRDEAMMRYSESVDRVFSQMAQKDSALEEIEQKLQAAITHINDNLSQTTNEIESVFNNFLFGVNARQKQLLEQLENEVDNKLDNHEVDLACINQRLERLVSSQSSILQAKKGEDVERMFVNLRKGKDVLDDPFSLTHSLDEVSKATFTYDKRNRANIMSTISDHGILMIED